MVVGGRGRESLRDGRDRLRSPRERGSHHWARDLVATCHFLKEARPAPSFPFSHSRRKTWVVS